MQSVRAAVLLLAGIVIGASAAATVLALASRTPPGSLPSSASRALMRGNGLTAASPPARTAASPE